MATTKKPEEKEEVKTNNFVIKPDKKWPSLVSISRERGNIPVILSGLYTNSREAQKAIDAYVGSK